MKLKYYFILGALLSTPVAVLNAQTEAPKKSAVKVAPAKVGKVDPHFVKARAHFDKGELTKSSDEIKAAATQIRVNLTGADAGLAAPALKKVKDLNTLADRVAEGKVKEGKTLDKNFATTSNVMSKYFAKVAEKAAKENKGKVAGFALNRTADYIENTAKWSGQKIGDAGKATVSNMREAGGNLVKAGGTVAKVPVKVIEGGVNLIGKLGKAITGQ